MFRNAYQRPLLTVLFGAGANPLQHWDTHVKDGYIRRILDPEINALVVEIRGSNISTAYMTCPKGNKALGISLPYMVMIVKNLKKYFSFEVTILDDTQQRRRFRVANFQTTTQIHQFSTVMPIGLADGWNQIQFNLADFTYRAYEKIFVEVQSIKVNANICIRRIYFAERLLSEEDLPSEYRLYYPASVKRNKYSAGDIEDKENVQSPTFDQLVIDHEEFQEQRELAVFPHDSVSAVPNSSQAFIGNSQTLLVLKESPRQSVRHSLSKFIMPKIRSLDNLNKTLTQQKETFTIKTSLSKQSTLNVPSVIKEGSMIEIDEGTGLVSRTDSVSRLPIKGAIHESGRDGRDPQITEVTELMEDLKAVDTIASSIENLSKERI